MAVYKSYSISSSRGPPCIHLFKCVFFHFFPTLIFAKKLLALVSAGMCFLQLHFTRHECKKFMPTYPKNGSLEKVTPFRYGSYKY